VGSHITREPVACALEEMADGATDRCDRLGKRDRDDAAKRSLCASVGTAESAEYRPTLASSGAAGSANAIAVIANTVLKTVRRGNLPDPISFIVLLPR